MGRLGRGQTWMAATVALLAPFAMQAQSTAPAGTKVVQITGLAGVKNKTKGVLLVDGSTMRFTHEAVKAEVPVSSVEDVITGADSQRFIHGAPGLLLMAAPYGSGRFLSLFRTKLDTLTIKYRDADGGLHGAIFTMPPGKAEAMKKDLLAMGAHTTAPVETGENKQPGAKEQKQ
jgi:hypothetical protein